MWLILAIRGRCASLAHQNKNDDDDDDTDKNNNNNIFCSGLSDVVRVTNLTFVFVYVF